MTGAERGFLLLCSHLGDPERNVLTTAQFRNLSRRMKNAPAPKEDRDLTAADLKSLGYGTTEAERIVTLLGEEERLDRYLKRAEQAGCGLLTLFSAHYPLELEYRLGDDAPALLWYKGNAELLNGPKIGLVGSRDLRRENAAFAHQAGLQAAAQGFTLVSGNARGADRTAQDACLAAGGQIISVVADALTRHTPEENILYLCEDSFDLDFSAHRALSRNRLIHAMGFATLVAQCRAYHGGTWDGSVKNLRFGWTPLFCYDDGAEGTRLLVRMGGTPIGMEELLDLSGLRPEQMTL